MKAGSKHLLWVVLLTILFGSTTYADTFTVDTIPGSGDMSGPAGSTVGWGYTITNESPDQWLVFLNVNTDTAFQHGTPNAFVFNSPIVAPNSTVTQAYNGIDGLFEFTWDPGAPAGFTNAGNFLLSAEWWSGDLLDESADAQFLASTPDFIVPYSVKVPAAPCSCAPPAAVPEPASVLLLTCGLGALVPFTRRRISR